MKYELRDQEKFAINLPSTFTKRNMYEKYCYENGWTIKLDNKGRYPALQDYTKRKVDDLLSMDDMDTSEVVAWWLFRQIWKEDCPKIQI
jgi:hypothetical protein